jgi:ribonuclease P protein component
VPPKKRGGGRPGLIRQGSTGSSGPVEFQRVYREGRRFLGTALALYVRPTDEHRRVGIAAGKRFGGAVVRNRAKRRLREAFRRLEGRLRDRGDLVLVARSPVLTAPFEAIVSEMEALCAAGHMLAEGSSHEASG